VLDLSVGPASPFVEWLVETYPDIRRPQEFEAAEREANPGIDLLEQAKKAKAWEIANPSQRKHNHARFLHGWFAREQDRGPRRSQAPTSQSEPAWPPPGPFSDCPAWDDMLQKAIAGHLGQRPSAAKRLLKLRAQQLGGELVLEAADRFEAQFVADEYLPSIRSAALGRHGLRVRLLCAGQEIGEEFASSRPPAPVSEQHQVEQQVEGLRPSAPEDQLEAEGRPPRRLLVLDLTEIPDEEAGTAKAELEERLRAAYRNRYEKALRLGGSRAAEEATRGEWIERVHTLGRTTVVADCLEQAAEHWRRTVGEVDSLRFFLPGLRRLRAPRLGSGEAVANA
jgi:hypothetical protein